MIQAGAYALLLAAGGGRRFGGGKLTAPWRGEPLVRAAARIALRSPAEHVIAVVGHDAAGVTAALHPLDAGRLVIVENPDWRDGLSSSLRAGLRALPPSAEFVILFLGDMPLIDPDVAGRLLEQLGDAPAILPNWRGKPAHPVVFRASIMPALAMVTGDRGARDALAALAGVRNVEVDGAWATTDVDTTDDLAGLPETAHRGSDAPFPNEAEQP